VASFTETPRAMELQSKLRLIIYIAVTGGNLIFVYVRKSNLHRHRPYDIMTRAEKIAKQGG